jgi:hypothetical protein
MVPTTGIHYATGTGRTAGSHRVRLSKGVTLTGKRPALESAAHRAEIRRLFEREVRNDGRTRESDVSVTVNAAGDPLRPRPWKLRVMDARTFRSEMLVVPSHQGQQDLAESFGTQYQLSSGE